MSKDVSEALDQLVSTGATLTLMAGLRDGNVITFTGARGTAVDGRYVLRGVVFVAGPVAALAGAKPDKIELSVEAIVWGGRV